MPLIQSLKCRHLFTSVAENGSFWGWVGGLVGENVCEKSPDCEI